MNIENEENAVEKKDWKKLEEKANDKKILHFVIEIIPLILLVCVLTVWIMSEKRENISKTFEGAMISNAGMFIGNGTVEVTGEAIYSWKFASEPESYECGFVVKDKDGKIIDDHIEDLAFNSPFENVYDFEHIYYQFLKCFSPEQQKFIFKGRACICNGFESLVLEYKNEDIKENEHFIFIAPAKTAKDVEEFIKNGKCFLMHDEELGNMQIGEPRE